MDFLKGFNWVVVLGIVVAVETQIGNGTMSLANMVPETWIPYVKAWAANLGSVGALIMSAGAFGPRPQGQFTVTPAVKTLIMAGVGFAALFVLSPDAQAQTKRPGFTGDAVKDIKAAIDQQKAAVTGVPANDPKAALPCMDISVITKITAENLVPTMKGCAQDVNVRLVTDTQRALDSAKAFTGNASNGGAAVGDNDAVNCLTPALALFKAAASIPATPDVPAVLNPDGSVKTPAVAGTPEIDPGPILLYQKYREFTLAGALTSCQAWFNGPVQATAAAGVGGAATALGGAALLSPLK